MVRYSNLGIVIVNKMVKDQIGCENDDGKRKTDNVFDNGINKRKK